MGAAIAKIFQRWLGDDTLWGGKIARIFRPWLGDADDDTLYGGHDDTLWGEAGFVFRVGDDVLYGGAGADTLWGFRVGDGQDTIADFADGDEDRITLEGVQAASLDANDIEFTGIAQEGVDVVVIMIAVGCVVACLTLIGWDLFWRRR